MSSQARRLIANTSLSDPTEQRITGNRVNTAAMQIFVERPADMATNDLAP